jgi:hypothetical protein
MPDRSPAVAGMFYPADEATCRRQIDRAVKGLGAPNAAPLFGGVVPHAGWVYSGRTAAHLFAALAHQTPLPETVVLFGAVHSWGAPVASLFGAGHWKTPLGALEVDAQLGHAILQAAEEKQVVDAPAAHASEHAIEVQLPFVAYLLPRVRILPIAMPPLSVALPVGRWVAEAAQSLGRRIAVVGSSDLTHYGPRYGLAPAGTGEPAVQWTHENDRRLLDLAVAMRADEVLAEAQAHHNACGAGAIAATITCCARLGATRGELLHYTTSYEVMPTGAASDLVGYGAVAYWG